MSNYTIGIDLGGTNTVFGIVDSKGTIVHKESFSTRTPDIESWCALLTEKIKRSINDNGIAGKITGIGIGAPCANTTTGCIEAATDLPWPSPIPIVELIKNNLHLPTVINNDANAAAIGEMIYGAAQGSDNFIVLTLGTGVGAGVVCDGHLLNGRNGFAGELGHITFHFAEDRQCGCGRKGCLQTVTSAKGIIDTAKRFGLYDETDIKTGNLTAKDVALAAESGNETAKRVFEFTGECLGRALAEYAAFSDPDMIILCGGVANAGELLLEPTVKAFNDAVLHLYKKVTIKTSHLKESDSAILGAASLPYLLKQQI